ncbi:transcription antitermination factor NusB [Mycoplasma sp. ATU-Cv-703]|uniref:transcription antitermination factor NusB n=1 Tax=Mycoplasma sp. ATU-Cv-703 TaxID=2498595 RepID=UPI000FDDCB4E
MAKSKLTRGERQKIVQFLYRFELFDQAPDCGQIFESGSLDAQALKALDQVCARYLELKNLVEKSLAKQWTWKRTAPLERAILVFGAYELSVNDAALVINELVELTKDLIPGQTYQYINSVLDKISAEDVKNKDRRPKT